MAIYYVPIYTQTASGSVSGITFNSIPQTYDDLMIKIAARTTSTGDDSLGLYLNGLQTNRSGTFLSGTGTGRSASRTTYRNIAGTPGTNTTASTFGNVELYIPNYRSSLFKSFIATGITENNGAAANQTIFAGLWSSTAAITSMTFDNASSGLAYAAGSTFSLYGIKNS